MVLTTPVVLGVPVHACRKHNTHPEKGKIFVAVSAGLLNYTVHASSLSRTKLHP